MPNASEACFWLIGRDNLASVPAVAVDIHDDNADVIGTHSSALNPHEAKSLMDQAREFAEACAAREGVPASDVHFDPDSTDAFALC